MKQQIEKKPTKPGFYWRMWRNQDMLPDVVEIVTDKELGLCVVGGYGYAFERILSPIEDEMEMVSFVGPISASKYVKQIN